MTWRFRKSFTVMPGLRLNVTPRGLSATVGAFPASVNVGPKGTYANIGIPGTGVYSRFKIGGAPHPQPSPLAPTPDHYSVFNSPASEEEIRSASTESLKSASLDAIAQLIQHVRGERKTISRELASAEGELHSALAKYTAWELGFLYKRIFRRSFQRRRERVEVAEAQKAELVEQLNLTVIKTDISVEGDCAENYFFMRDEFSCLAKSAAIWDKLSRSSINRVATRSAAKEAVKRSKVKFNLQCCPFIDWEHPVPHLTNATGGDMFVYPGFVLYKVSDEAFALIDLIEISFKFNLVNFFEEDPIPADANIVGQSWAKCNKDGSPDLRFKNNYQIPIARYAEFGFHTDSGLREEYHASNAEAAIRFAKAWERFFISLKNLRNLP